MFVLSNDNTFRKDTPECLLIDLSTCSQDWRVFHSANKSGFLVSQIICNKQVSHPSCWNLSQWDCPTSYRHFCAVSYFEDCLCSSFPCRQTSFCCHWPTCHPRNACFQCSSSPPSCLPLQWNSFSPRILCHSIFLQGCCAFCLDCVSRGSPFCFYFPQTAFLWSHHCSFLCFQLTFWTLQET